LGSALILGSCASKEPIDHGPGFCTIECATPTIKINLDNLPPAELSKAMLKRFVADGSYTNAIDTSYGQPFTVTNEFDYEIRLTSGTIITIGSIKITPTSKYDYCGETCADALTNFRMLYDYDEVPIRWELSEDEKEYIVHMK
jgi:hypothetical protein